MNENSQEPVTVYSVQGLLRANVIQGVLKSAGIPVFLSYESIGVLLGMTMDSIGRVDIKVPAQWASEALEILNAKPRTGEIFSVPDGFAEKPEE